MNQIEADAWVRFAELSAEQPASTDEDRYAEATTWVDGMGHVHVRGRRRLNPELPGTEYVTYGKVRYQGFGVPEAVCLWMERAPHWHPIEVRLGPVVLASSGTMRCHPAAAEALTELRDELLALLGDGAGRKLGGVPDGG